MDLDSQNIIKNEVVIFEYPLQENIRNYLRLESLFQQYQRNSISSNKDSHIHALKILFEILEILERNDTRTELIKELTRLFDYFQHLKQNPNVDNSKLNTFLNQIEKLNHWAHHYKGKFGEKTRQSPFITSVKSRSSIPGGNCFFDCPELYLFLNKSIEERLQNFELWFSDIKGVGISVEVILRLIRDSSNWQKNIAASGKFILETSSKPPKLLRIKNISCEKIFPEFSCGKHRSSIRFMTFSQQHNRTSFNQDVKFDLSCCH